MLRQIEPDIFENHMLYRLCRSNHSTVYSSNLDVLRSYSLRRGYSSERGHRVTHQATGEYLSLNKPEPLPGGALQPGSNLWYRGIPIPILRVEQLGVQEWSISSGWCISHHTGNTLCRARYLPELEYQEVSLDFLISGAATLPSEEYRKSLVRAFV